MDSPHCDLLWFTVIFLCYLIYRPQGCINLDLTCSCNRTVQEGVRSLKGYSQYILLYRLQINKSLGMEGHYVLSMFFCERCHRSWAHQTKHNQTLLHDRKREPALKRDDQNLRFLPPKTRETKTAWLYLFSGGFTTTYKRECICNELAIDKREKLFVT